VDLLDDEGRVRRVAASSAHPVDADLLGSLESQEPHEPGPHSPLSIVSREGGPVLFKEMTGAEVAAAVQSSDGPAAREGSLLRSALVVPLSGRDHLMGALTMAWAASERRFDEADLPMAADLGRRAGMALENARLYEAKRSTAETLQRALLPGAPPPVSGLSTAVRYVAATSGAEVGGDWYEVMALADGRVGIAVGDAMGHGVEAAALMGTVRNVLRSHALSGADPAEVVRRLDEFMSGSDLNLATVLYGCYDPRTRLLRWVNAGHPPPLLLGPGPVVQFLEGGHRTMVGIGVGGDDVGEVLLPEGATLVLYTDGLIEDRHASLDEGLDRVAKAAAANHGREPDALLDKILHPLLERPHLEDDVAVLAARVTPS
jgi:serine phosphatase RsbU (regulator of sigma subunit)